MNLNSAHIHLLLNHFPIVGAIFGLLLLIYSIFKTSDDLKQASYWTFIIVALITIPTYIYGTQAADIVLNLANVTDAYVHKHKELAEVSLITLEILGTLSIVGLFFSRSTKKTVNWLTMTILAIAIIGTVLVAWTGLQGGVIRHTEVRGDIPLLTPDHSDTQEQNNHSHE